MLLIALGDAALRSTRDATMPMDEIPSPILFSQSSERRSLTPACLPHGVVAQLEKRMGEKLASEGESLVDETRARRSYFGVHKQPDGKNYVGVHVPVGRLSSDDMIAVAHIAETYGAHRLLPSRVRLKERVL